MNEELKKAFETITKYCEKNKKNCKYCTLGHACTHYFEYGTLYGFANTAIKLLSRAKNDK